MKMIAETLGTIGKATAANLIGRAANVIIALSVISFCGADARTDIYFLIMAVAFFFFGVVSNAVTTATAPLQISGRLFLAPANIIVAGTSCTAFVCLTAFIWALLIHPFALVYVVALGLMSGAGIANGFATGALYAGENYILPGLTWSLRLIPLTIFLMSGPGSEKLVWLAVGIGLMDWVRFALLGSRAISKRTDNDRASLKTLANSFAAYSKVMAASMIMGLNPIIDRMIARLNGPGGISILESGERIYMMLASVCTIGMTTVLLTRLSREAAADRLEANWARTIFLAGLWNGFWLLVGFALGWWGLALWLDAFTPLSVADSRAAQWVYWSYLIGLPAFAFGVTYVKRLQALQRWGVMVATSVLSVIINIPLSLLLNSWIGIPGIALATSIISFVNCGVLIAAAHVRPSG